MSVPNFFLLTAALINLVMSAFLFFWPSVGKTRSVFSLALLFTALWAFSTFYFRVSSDSFTLLLLPRLTDIFALCILVSLLFFNKYYPFYEKLRNIDIFLILCSGIFSIFILTFPEYISQPVHYGDWSAVSTHTAAYAVFAMLIASLSVRCIFHLLRSFRLTSGSQKYQVLLVLIGVLFSLTLAFIFSVISLLINEKFFYLYFAWIGPTSSLLMNAIIFSILYKRD